jgi:HlyD family secretion protein
MKRKSAILLAFAIGVGAAGDRIAGRLCHNALAEPLVSAAPSSSAETYVAVVSRGDVNRVVAGAGVIVANREVAVRSRASGDVTNCFCDVGDRVSRGDLLVQLDPSVEQAAVDQAQVVLSQARQKLSEVQQARQQHTREMTISIAQADQCIDSARVKATNLAKKLDRQKQLLADSLGSQEDFEAAQTDAVAAAADLQNAILEKENRQDQSTTQNMQDQADIDSAQEQVTQDQQAVNTATRKLAATRIAAPIDGVVSDVNVSAGATLDVSESDPGASEKVMTLCDLSRLFLNAAVKQADIGAVKPGQKAEITVDAYPNRIYIGSVMQIAPTAEAGAAGNGEKGEAVFQVKIEVTDAEKDSLKPGMAASVRIICQTRDNVIVVPSSAVLRRLGNFVVSVMDKAGNLVDRVVQIGQCDASHDEILSGIAPGERVVARKPLATQGGMEVASEAGE